MTIALSDCGLSFQRHLAEWWNEETESVLRRIERWASSNRGYNRLRSIRTDRNDRKERTRLNCCGVDYKSRASTDNNCLESYSLDHSIYFKTIGDIKTTKDPPEPPKVLDCGDFLASDFDDLDELDELENGNLEDLRLDFAKHCARSDSDQDNNNGHFESIEFTDFGSIINQPRGPPEDDGYRPEQHEALKRLLEQEEQDNQSFKKTKSFNNEEILWPGVMLSYMRNINSNVMPCHYTVYAK